MAREKDGCVKPARGPIMPAESEGSPGGSEKKEVIAMQARVGREAPDFEANAYVAGEGFKTVRLSGFKGKWIVLCFYPGDFTFV
jgi:peroxiredoxin (alkyl hydroperoxide reductase subunit C)